MSRVRVAACQLDVVVGDLDGNVSRVLRALERAEAEGCDVAVFPELALTGYPPEDLLLKPGFVADNRAALEKVAARSERCAAVVGFVDAGRDLYNAAAVCASGAVQGVYRKRLLPNYGVFDEQRYFAPSSDEPSLFVIGGVRMGVSICEDAWAPAGPIAEQAAGGAELILNLNASPYHAGRLAERERMLATRAADASCALVYVNLVGGQDELVFDGASLVLDTDGHVVARGPQFVEDVMVVDVDVRPVFRKRLLDPRGRARSPRLPQVVVTEDPRRGPGPEAPVAGPSAPSRLSASRSAPRSVGPLGPLAGPLGPLADPLPPTQEVYEALVLGTRDYVRKNSFTDAVVGLSGGIDSSLVATIAVDALGPEHVHGVSMPSRYSSTGSIDDARRLADNLGIDFREIPIEPAHAALVEMLGPSFEGLPEDLTEENIQARVRGVLLMALSNKFGWMVLATGNKSELAMGFATLYGDLAGGFAVIKDVPKHLVYDLALDRNRRGGDHPPIPQAVLDKPPSAELRPGQRDDDALPPYSELDPVLEAYIEGDATAGDLEKAGFPAELVRRVVSQVDRAEYKRRQAPPGVRVTPKAFGKDRRLPVTNGYQ